jgi:putative tricarboxylic transport membrane protein
VRLVDRRVGAALALLSAAVLWSARAFPNVPGQKLGAAFLPMLIGAGLGVCGLALVVRSFRGAYPVSAEVPDDRGTRRAGAFAVVGAVVAYLLLADRLGFLLVAPVILAVLFVALQVKLSHALLWAAVGTLVVHAAFYKLLRVPLPWGVLRPFY